MKCSIMQYFIWIFTVCKSTHLEVLHVQRFKKAILFDSSSDCEQTVHMKGQILFAKEWCHQNCLLPSHDCNFKLSDLYYRKDLVTLHLGLIATKHVFGVSEKARQKPVSSATETS